MNGKIFVLEEFRNDCCAFHCVCHSFSLRVRNECNVLKSIRVFVFTFSNAAMCSLTNPNLLNFYSISFVCVFFGGCIRFYVRNEQIALPTAPTDVIISEVAATSVRLEWSYKGPEDLQYYVIQYKPKNANQVSVSAQMWFKPPAMCSGKFCGLKNELGSTFATRFNPAGWRGTKIRNHLIVLVTIPKYCS